MSSPTEASIRDYYDGGAGDEVTLAENIAAWRAVRFRPRVLRNVADVSTRIALLGSDLSSPVLVAPTALHGLAHPDGESATRRGTAQAGSLMIVSTRSSVPIEQVAESAQGPWWMQVYAMRDRALTFDLVGRAAAAGATALVLTGDTPVVGTKKRPSQGIDVPALHLRNLRAQTRRTDLSAFDVEQDPTVDLRFIEELATASGLPVLVKGVVRGDDALECVAAGASGVIVSNHGGRQLDRAIPTAEALPEVVAAVGGAVPVIVDGGIRNGLDVLAAIALGARSVMVGRPVLHALWEGGSGGVTRLLDGLREELAHAMALAGVLAPGEAPPDLVSTTRRAS